MRKHAMAYNLNDSKNAYTAQSEHEANIESAQYIADMILELRNLAKAAEFNTLQGLLEISYYEAHGAANRMRIPENEETFLHELGSDSRKAAAVA
jgi:hypothetical protein